MQKVISCKADEVDKKVQPLLDKGWEIVSVTAERVSVAMTSSGYTKLIERGLMVFVLTN